MTVDSFKFLPRIIATFYQMTEREPQYPIPWTPITTPLDKAKIALVTSAGFYCKTHQEPFDLEREKKHPYWGDPSYRVIPAQVAQEELGISHLHLNTSDLALDFNIQLPLDRMSELSDEGRIGSIAEEHYSFMGYQGFPPDTSAWEDEYGPQVAQRMLAEEVQIVLLTPA